MFYLHSLGAVYLDPFLGLLEGAALSYNKAVEPHPPLDQGRGAVVVGLFALDGWRGCVHAGSLGLVGHGVSRV